MAGRNRSGHIEDETSSGPTAASRIGQFPPRNDHDVVEAPSPRMAARLLGGSRRLAAVLLLLDMDDETASDCGGDETGRRRGHVGFAGWPSFGLYGEQKPGHIRVNEIGQSEIRASLFPPAGGHHAIHIPISLHGRFRDSVGHLDSRFSGQRLVRGQRVGQSLKGVLDALVHGVYKHIQRECVFTEKA